VNVRSVWARLHLGGERQAHVLLLLALAHAGRARHPGPASQHGRGCLAFREGLLAPRARDDVLGRLPLLDEVHRDLREELGGASLHEEHLVAVRDPEQLAQQGDGLVVDGFVLLAAMAVLHDGHAALREVQHLVARALQGRERERGRASVEVLLAVHVDLPLARSGSGHFVTGEARLS